MSLGARIGRLLLALLVAGAALLVWLTLDYIRTSIHEEMEAGTRVATRILGAWLSQGNDDPAALRGFLDGLGRVRANEIRLVSSGQTLYVSPPPAYKLGREAPDWFARLVTPPLTPVTLQAGAGVLEIRPDPSRSVLDAWDDLTRLLLPPLVLLAAAIALVFWRLGRDLAPVGRIEEALGRVEKGERHLRLPPFGVSELERIGAGFNRMVERLAHTEKETRGLEKEVYAEGVARAQLEQARNEWARELHDELGQNLTAIGTLARAIANRSDAGPVADAAALIQTTARQVHEDLRAMLTRMRATDDGIELALSRLAEHWRACHPDTPLELDCVPPLPTLDEAQRLALFRVAQEALTNVARHAQATNVWLRLSRQAARLELEIRDDGCGFDARQGQPERFGLVGMAERMAECAGSVQIHSEVGQGTRIVASLPY